jgi:hypothetical protein
MFLIFKKIWNMILQIHPRIHNFFVLISENEYHTRSRNNKLNYLCTDLVTALTSLEMYYFPHVCQFYIIRCSLMQWLSLTKLNAGMTYFSLIGGICDTWLNWCALAWVRWSSYVKISRQFVYLIDFSLLIK